MKLGIYNESAKSDGCLKAETLISFIVETDQLRLIWWDTCIFTLGMSGEASSSFQIKPDDTIFVSLLLILLKEKMVALWQNIVKLNDPFWCEQNEF